MRILFVVDGRSPIALNWISGIIQQDHEVHLLSTYPCQPDLNLASLKTIPLPFSQISQTGQVNVTPTVTPQSILRSIISPRLRTTVRQWITPLSLKTPSARLAEHINRIKPDLIHAMRIPYEGMLAARACANLAHPPPLLISVWGNDFTLHASSTPFISNATRQTLFLADGLHTDCRRDLRLATDWGFDSRKPAIVLPGGGGIQSDLFHPPQDESERDSALIINPRGLRAYVRNDTFFNSIPAIVEQYPQVRFLCAGMAGQAQAEAWAAKFDRKTVSLLPHLSRHQMADLFQRAQIVLSITEHDGTPNTLLEAMACGCFPIAGDIESIREWINDKSNGLLVPPDDASSLARAVLKALADPPMRASAMHINLRLIAERAEYSQVMHQAEEFYRKIARNQ